MKPNLMKLGMAAAAILTMASCAASGGGPNAAVACPKCKTVWVTAGASAGKGNPIALKGTGAMECPDCRNAASPMLKGLTSTTHTCKSCGGAMFHCR